MMPIWIEDEVETSTQCLDCLKDTFAEPGDYYMLHDALWQAIAAPPEQDAMLCVSCASKRLGRPFTEDDFLVSPVEMVARLVTLSLARMTDQQKQRVVDAREELAEHFPDIQPELSALIKHLSIVN
jgi:hypothetical protein